MRDNQNTDLIAAKKWQAIEVAHHAEGIARMENAIENTKFAEWTEVNNVRVLRVGNSPIVAVPHSNRKNSKFDIINLDTLELVCQVRSTEVHGWLVRAS